MVLSSSVVFVLDETFAGTSSREEVNGLRTLPIVVVEAETAVVVSREVSP